jgi:polar amino acid transport system ATP-binding protein
LRCINGLEPIQDGRITVDGEAVEAHSRTVRQIREKVGFVFQSFNLFPYYTALENVSLAPRIVKRLPAQEAQRIAEEMLRRVGLSDKLEAYPDRLSGGQQQRVAIARALAMSPELMLFDEVTSALDPELVGEVLKVMQDLAEGGMTMIVVTHEMGFARRVGSRVLFFHEGQIAEEGPPDQIFTNPGHENLRTFIQSIL